MSILPDPIQKLILALERLPGIGPKTASRLAFFLLRAPDELSVNLSEALKNLKSSTGFCSICFNITLVNQDICDVCANPERDAATICVVEDSLDVLAMERTGGYHGRYHVLNGVLSPIEGIGPGDLRIRELIERVKEGSIKEIILATNPSMEGDATALYLRQQLAPFGVCITRLARGLPVGGDLEYADQNTLLRALSGRQEM
ncbi:MAG TPA: recombination protein RecR [Anaerolineae bacterium]|nr:recombination protein RecR [Anaerolineae bacterium]